MGNGARPAVLAGGIITLEFAAAVTRFVGSTLLPVVADDLGAGNQLGLLIAGSTLGLFIALPLAGRVLHHLGARTTLAAGTVAYIGGLVLAATSQTAWVFALGQLAGGLASGVLGVFGVSAAIEHLDDKIRARVIAASSAMWILPALVGPPVILALEHLAGWRWTLLMPVPIVLIGRLLIVRTVRDDRPQKEAPRPLGRTLLVPLGAACIVLGGGWWPITVLGSVAALAGMVAIMPRGTARLSRGTPAALGAMVLFALGYFGADSLVTVLLTTGFHVSLARAAVVLSAAPLAWALASLAAARFAHRRGKRWFPVVGLTLTAIGTLVLAVQLALDPSYPVALVAWTVAGVGVGLAYPALYLMATTAGTSGFGAAELATAVITAEAIGSLLGQALGGAISNTGESGGLLVSYAVFGVALAAAAGAAVRSGEPGQ
ncbi:MFS transporter [Amycolatopsis acidicola]|uniref:MFS transporter n=1 Tax=Amycolatopsis acidicola TaxID=2596893 RepID=A0A5N0VLF6_9PSEU|nr:MFS transporter [Amycolatopsis acidicola]KAA9165562.1 MFS transporter [Amycolatopsis acidicola]